jgi:hypothetical protein
MSTLTSWLADARLDAAVEIAPGWVTALSAAGGALVLNGASEALPPGALVASLASSNVHERHAVVEAVRAALAAIDSRPKRVALVIPDLTSRLSLVSFDQIPARHEDLNQLIRWQVRRSAPFPIEDAVVGYTDAGVDADGRRTFAVVLARREVVREYEQVCAECGAQAGLVDIATLSAINLILGAGSQVGQDSLVVHLRPEYTSLAIMRGAQLLFFRSRDVAEGETVADLIHQTVMYYHDRLGGQEFVQVFLGGQGQDSGAIEAARKSLNARLGVVVDAMDLSAMGSLPAGLADDQALMQIAGPAAGMLLRAQGEVVGA